MINFKKVFLKDRNNKLAYYVKAILKSVLPYPYCRWRKDRLIRYYDKLDKAYIQSRVDYYNKLDTITSLSADAIAVKDYKIPDKIRVYYFDSIEYLRYFDRHFKFEIIPGDVIHVPSCPAIVKSRPIHGDNVNSVLLNLDKARHFNFIQDDIPFEKKKNLLVGRSGFSQTHRARFFDMYAQHPLCDIKKAARKSDPDFLSIPQHLNYKFILALEGNDVATNLKWIMSSNSIAVMPMPTYETWFMEGTLIPDYHFICIKHDYSDLEEKLNYYIEHPAEALHIVENAHSYVDQFKDKKQEDIISLLVLEKYFKFTDQDKV